MSVVERKSAKHQERITTITKQKGVQTKMSTITVKDIIDDTSGSTNSVYDKIYNLIGKGASTDLGQFTIEKMDNLISIIETTAKWSLPESMDSKTSSENTKENISQKLERPCGWVPFLFLIVTLRCTRIGLSFGSIMIGNEPVTPESMVDFLQTRRRKLRAIKYQGLKTLRTKQKAAEERSKRTGVIEQLTSLFNMVACGVGRLNSCNSDTSSTTLARIDKIEKISKSFEGNNRNLNMCSNQSQIQAQKRPLEEDDASANECDSDEELHCTQLLDKYGDKGSDFEDSDYVPESKDEELSSSEIDEDEDDEADEGISEEETANNEVILDQKNNDSSGNSLNGSFDKISAADNALPKANGPTILVDKISNTSSENGKESSNSTQQDNSLSSTTAQPSLSKLSPTKSSEINPLRVSPKIGLRVRCQDLARLSYGEECFFSPIGSPSINDGPTNNYLQSQLPSVIISSVSSTSLPEHVNPNQSISDNSANENQMSAHESINEANKGNHLKSQNSHPQRHQQNKKNYYNNYKQNKGRKLH